MNKKLSIFACLIVCSMVNSSSGKEWAKKMFETLEHDFGTVARGAHAEFDFKLRNLYKEDIHIASVRSSCGCTTPTILKPTLKSWEFGAIRTKYNTRQFLGKKNATITVVIDKPFEAEVQLTVNGFIRQDVVLHPGSVDFGEVDAGSSAEKRIRVSYAGRGDWAIDNVKIPNDHYEVDFQEKNRTNERVDYDMLVRVNGDAPPGYLNEQMIIVSNDRALAEFPFMIKGRILPSITVSPSSLSLGVLQPGQRVTKQLVVRSKREFQVTDVRCDGDCLSFESPEGKKKLHFIPVTFTAGEDPGDLLMNITIETNLGKGAIAKCKATASVQ